LLNLDEWLSKHLGYTSYNLDYKNLYKFNFLNLKLEKCLITIKSPKIINKYFLRKNKIYLVNKNLTFFKFVDNNKTKKEINFKHIRFAKYKDKKLILNLAESSFVNSRFFRDKKIRKKLAKKVKRNWVLNFFKKQRGDYLIVSEINKKVVGFLLMLKNKKDYVIDLIAVNKEYRNNGLASQMLRFFENFLTRKNKLKIYASTQQNNKEAIEFYTKNKFRIKYKKYIYHFNSC
jgi:ribosomal protein S18 acetylase RimI-like enzyme